MEVRDKLTVQEWDEPIPPGRDSRPIATATWQSPVILGVLGTLLFHVILVASLGFFFEGRRNFQNKPDQNQIPALSSSESLTLLALSPMPRSRQINIDLRPLSNMLDNAPLLLKPPPSAHTERLALADEPAAVGNAELIQAAEIYDRQIRARIERIWQRPRTTLTASSAEGSASDSSEVFRCQAQLEQDDRGNVKEVLLPDCSGSLEWRESLLTAIRQASPLPAPPDPRVFSSSLVLHFVVATRTTNGPPND